jgi:hypothetical protein
MRTPKTLPLESTEAVPVKCAKLPRYFTEFYAWLVTPLVLLPGGINGAIIPV